MIILGTLFEYKRLMMKPFLHILLLFIALTNVSYAQSRYDSVSFASPVDIPLVLAGNFAELRSNHFHTGLDIKTQGVEGKNIYSIEEGYISRIRISHYGYGKCVYVTHPNGFTSVYAHLQKFSDKIEQHIRPIQYQNRSELLDIPLEPNQIKVSKKELIALSGNSGSSTAPHLHFEIRDTKTEHAINPLLFNFHIKDDVAPTIYGIKLYSLNDGFINGKNADVKFATEGLNGTYYLKGYPKIEVDGEIGFAIHAIDRLNDANNRCGVYKVELYLDDKLICSQRLDQMNFDVNRYINAYKDFEEFHKNNLHYHRSFLLPNNPLSVYESVENNGKITLTDGAKHTILYKVYDVYNNMSSISFEITHNPTMTKQDVKPIRKGMHTISLNQPKQIETEAYSISFDDSTFYEDVQLPVVYDDMHHKLHLNNPYLPVQKYFALKINASHIPEHLHEKTLVVKFEKGQLKPKKGTLENGWISTELKETGSYYLVPDTTAPNLKEINFSNGQSFKGWMAFKWTIRDDLSGIHQYHCYIDNEWVLSTYWPQKNLLEIHYSELKDLPKGQHTLTIELTDERKNSITKSYTFIRE
jgi:murein DD-endopeptidase MepM/ murein hydrolase activator NlpD